MLSVVTTDTSAYDPWIIGEAKGGDAMAEFITCPKCGSHIPLTDAITHQVEERLQTQLEERDKAYAERLAEREEELREEFAADQAKRLKKLEADAEKKVRTELDDMRAQIGEQEKELAAARKLELGVRAQQRQLEKDREALDLELARKIDVERKKIAQEAMQQDAERHRLELAEKDLAMEQMQKKIRDLEESVQQTRAGLRGEVLERDIEDLLREAFPQDEITPIKAGQRGADVLQTVRTSRAGVCGKILWESKRAQNWQRAWVKKLKDDQANAHADLGVIVAAAVPDEVHVFAQHDGVWISETSAVVPLAAALREGLVSVNQARSIDENKNEALDGLYEYLCSPGFNQRLRKSVETFIDMKKDLDSEQRSAETRFRKRGQQLQHLVLNTAGIYGELSAIMGSALPTVDLLELPAAE